MAGDGRVLQPVLEHLLTEALVQGLSLDKVRQAGMIPLS